MGENEYLDENDPVETEDAAEGTTVPVVPTGRGIAQGRDEDTDDDYDPYEEERRRELEEKTRKKRRKRTRSIVIKLVIFALVVVAVIFFLIRRAKKATAVEYQSDTAALRDISTSNSYTGTIAAVDSQSVMSAVSGVKVTEVLVEEGDVVQEGDVIALSLIHI